MRDFPAALAKYKQAISIGSNATLTEMFAALDTPFPFTLADAQKAIAIITSVLDKR